MYFDFDHLTPPQRAQVQAQFEIGDPRAYVYDVGKEKSVLSRRTRDPWKYQNIPVEWNARRNCWKIQSPITDEWLDTLTPEADIDAILLVMSMI